jgi:hypothetical protein
MVNEARLGEVLTRAAQAIELLYVELDRKPPIESVDLIEELRQFAAEFSN